MSTKTDMAKQQQVTFAAYVVMAVLGQAQLRHAEHHLCHLGILGKKKPIRLYKFHPLKLFKGEFRRQSWKP